MLDCLDFMKFVYGVLGMTYRLELSTKPEKALGDDHLWEIAEEQLRQALNEFTGVCVCVCDALERAHQCATIQPTPFYTHTPT